MADGGRPGPLALLSTYAGSAARRAARVADAASELFLHQGANQGTSESVPCRDFLTVAETAPTTQQDCKGDKLPHTNDTRGRDSLRTCSPSRRSSPR